MSTRANEERRRAIEMWLDTIIKFIDASQELSKCDFGNYTWCTGRAMDEKLINVSATDGRFIRLCEELGLTYTVVPESDGYIRYSAEYKGRMLIGLERKGD